MTDHTDPVQRALEKARERGEILPDEPSGLSPSFPDPFPGQRPKIPLPWNANVARQRDQAFSYQPMVGPDSTSLHKSLPADKQEEIAELLLQQQLQQNEERFKREMEKEDQRMSRSRLLVFSLLKIVKWMSIVFGIGFIGLVTVLGVTGWRAGSLSDTSILATLVNFFATIIGTMASNSGL